MVSLQWKLFLFSAIGLTSLVSREKKLVSASSKPAGKNLIVLNDGTGMEINADGRDSNVLRLFEMLKRDNEQRVFYGPGIGTPDNVDAWTWLENRFRCVFGLATGAGLDQDVLLGYRFLMNNYEDGDRIYLFGFSRGGFTSRVLAGLIHEIGILHRDQKNLLPYAYLAYKKAMNSDGGARFRESTERKRTMDEHEAVADRIADISNACRPKIHFVGCWDSVNSVIIPRPDRFMIPSLLKLAYTRENDSIKYFRQAAAIDERRRMFRLCPWYPGNGDKSYPTDTKQLWFPGCHGDVGGGWPRPKSGLSKNALVWMVNEATQKGLRVDQNMYDKIALGKGPSSEHPPDSLGNINQSLKLFSFWSVLEVLPRYNKLKEWKLSWRRPAVLFGLYYFPFAEPRYIRVKSDDSKSAPLPVHDLHDSVYERMNGDSKYRPPNVMQYLREVREHMNDHPKLQAGYQKYMKFLET